MQRLFGTCSATCQWALTIESSCPRLPAGTVFYSQSGSAPYEQSSIGVECDAESGTILTARPTALVFSSDGVTPTPVNDFQAFVPVNTGALEVRSPTTGYQGRPSPSSASRGRR